MPDLLIELFSEEIPARMQVKAAEDLRRLVTDGLVEAGLTYAGAAAFSTPRRLVLSVEGLSSQSQTLKEERKGPPIDANPKAVRGYLRGLGIEAPDSWYDEKIASLKKGEVILNGLDLIRTTEVKGRRVIMATLEWPARTAADIVAEVLEKAIRGFPWPKSMRWGEGTLRWVRPLHAILCILSDEAGAEVVPLDIDGITSGNTTKGHRFMAPAPITVHGFEDYETKLKRAFVVLRAEERAELIWHDATNQAFAQGLEIVEDRGLLAEVAGLVEWPVVLMGPIDEAFLDLPPEVLQTSMREHQKFFSVRNPKTGRIERFVTVANIETADNGATILAGNGKVLSARLSDAKFFWQNDLRTIANVGLEGMAEGLARVTFVKGNVEQETYDELKLSRLQKWAHESLGTQEDRINRIAFLASEISLSIECDSIMAKQAAKVSKADLASEMVNEFPELQGVMGRYYSKAAGFSDDISNACEEHWSPVGPLDAVPHKPISIAVALADKIDTLVGFWVIDERPTGSRDPFGLRRSALGIIRIVLENKLRIKLLSEFENWLPSLISSYMKRHNIIVTQVRATGSQGSRTTLNQMSSSWEDGHEGDWTQIWFSNVDELEAGLDPNREDFEVLGSTLPLDRPDQVLPSLLAFLHDRLKVHLRDQGIPHDVIDACLAMPGNDDLTLLVKRAEALAAFLKTDDGENLLQGFKRANNILSQAEEKDGVEYSYGADPKWAETDAEKALFSALDTADAAIKPAMEAEDFGTAMTAMAALRVPIDAFFEAVQVNAENAVLRRNRLNLLSRIRVICLSVADLSKLDG